MKKLLSILLVVLLLVAMTGCGNMTIGFGDFEFQKVHVDTYHYSGCLTVEKWRDVDTGIEVKTKEAGSLFLSEGTYILLEGEFECPFCAGAD